MEPDFVQRIQALFGRASCLRLASQFSASMWRRESVPIASPQSIGLATILLGLVLATGFTATYSDRLQEAQRLYERGDLRNTVRLCLDHLERRPWDKAAPRLAALALSRMEFANQAEPYYEQAGDWPALQLEDSHIRAYGLLRANRLDLSLKGYEVILDRWPENALALQRMATVLLAQRRYPDALAYARRLAAVPGKEVVGYALLGMVAHQDGVPEDASAAYEQVIRLDPKLAGLPYPKELFWSEFIGDLIKSGRLADARRFLTSASAVGTPDTQLIDLEGRVAFLEGDVSSAENLWNRAYRNDPKLVGPLVGLGQIELKRGKADKAVEWLSQAIHLAPDHAEATYQLSLARRLQGKAEDADSLRKRSETLRLNSGEPIQGMGAMPAVKQ